MARRAWVVAGLVGVVLAGAGCSSSTPDPAATTPSQAPTPTPTPTPDAAEAQKQAAVAEAQATLTKFFDASNQVGEGGYADWSPLSPLVGGELRPTLISINDDRRAAGARQTGRAAVESVEVVGYEPGQEGGGGEQVQLEACIDNTNRKIVLADGSSDTRRTDPMRIVITYTVQNNETFWTVNSLVVDPNRTC